MMYKDPRMEEEERRKRMMQHRIAQSQVEQSPLAQRQGLNPTPAGGQSGIRSQLLKSALGSMMGPAGGILGGLFNEGGKVSNDKGNSWWNWFYGSKAGKKGSFRDQSNWGNHQNRNMGGPISANPHGYNEGGAVMETPIKKVMDEQKLEQQAKAFELEQKRKQEAHAQAMRIKEQQARQAAAMKKASATTTKKPKAPLAK